MRRRIRVDADARRRWLVPEVVQTSGMDCGPAVLACLLGGYGIRASYGRLREACHTGVNGTSIDALEDVANLAGLEAQQTIAPVEHLALDCAELLPAIVLTRQPTGLLHFVLVWSRHGSRLQVMDPAVGRRWVPVDDFLTEVWLHEFAVPSVEFEAFAASPAFRDPLRDRMARLGLSDPEIDTMFESADSLAATCTLDAAARQAAHVGSRQDGSAADLLHVLADGSSVPDEFYFARPSGDVVELRGAVLLSGRRRSQQASAAVPPELQAALDEPAPRPIRTPFDLLSAPGRAGMGVGLLAAMVLGGLCEVLLLRRALAGGGLGWLPALATALLLLDLCATGLTLALGRRLELALRSAWYEHLPRLPDHYLTSRPVSDLTERAHRLHQLRELPVLAGDLVLTVLTLVGVVAVIGWTSPASLVAATTSALISVAVCAAAQPRLVERDLRLRSHSGAITSFLLNAMLGIVPIRTHHAERVITDEHDRLLAEWTTASRAVTRTEILAHVARRVASVITVGWVLWTGRELAAVGPARFLLLAFLALWLPLLGDRLGMLTRQWPWLRSILLRFLEPLGTPVDDPPVEIATVERGALSLRGVRVAVAGHDVLTDIDLDVCAGQFVTVVGASGAGKSTLLNVLLGWHRPTRGEILLDGVAVEAAALRRHVTWIDPEVRLWDASLADNLRYGLAESTDLREVLSVTGLNQLSARLGDRPLGEGGRLLSSGEAQLVRIGRALLRRDARIVLLDEAFRGLDTDEAGRLSSVMRDWWPAATILMVSHHVTDALTCDRVIVMADGQIAEDGDPVRLLTDPQSTFAGMVRAAAESRAQLDRWQLLSMVAGALRSPAVVP